MKTGKFQMVFWRDFLSTLAIGMAILLTVSISQAVFASDPVGGSALECWNATHDGCLGSICAPDWCLQVIESGVTTSCDCL
ncbi:MAG: hypothetical protein SGJ20_07845 [Planctomycetota bacterium]|nr:hypothetical protein [Planctomycetota bacterium]